jgi:hypothetical protein
VDVFRKSKRRVVEPGSLPGQLRLPALCFLPNLERPENEDCRDSSGERRLSALSFFALFFLGTDKLRANSKESLETVSSSSRPLRSWAPAPLMMSRTNVYRWHFPGSGLKQRNRSAEPRADRCQHQLRTGNEPLEKPKALLLVFMMSSNVELGVSCYCLQSQRPL